jgi:pimeloyl-ACP methyl ester carboxylesterase
MPTVTSADGTTIAYERVGQGPPLVLVDGALCYRASGPSGPLAAALADRFTVHTYDRRGRGDSGDTPPYAIEREVEDVAALVAAAGGRPAVYGISSGAALALEAAARGVPMTRLALYEAPYVVDDSRAPVDAAYVARMDELAGTAPGAAVRHFMRNGVGLPAVVAVLMRLMPGWSKLTAVAHTLPYDTALTADLQGGRPLPRDRWSGVDVPTLVIAGTKSPAWIQQAMRELAEVVPGARHHRLEGQTHMVKPAALAPVLTDFLTATEGSALP